uniref:Uncharacterized protein n=1 Tax=Lepeophtheirus salmonis TaxID=72036 RepID=A0A0K2TKY4_LEPSM
MSVNTSSYTFRRVDVDQFNEDNFHDETENGTNINNNNCDSNTNIESDVQNFLNSNKTLDALKLILQTSPVSSSVNYYRLLFIRYMYIILMISIMNQGMPSIPGSSHASLDANPSLCQTNASRWNSQRIRY